MVHGLNLIEASFSLMLTTHCHMFMNPQIYLCNALTRLPVNYIQTVAFRTAMANRNAVLNCRPGGDT